VRLRAMVNPLDNHGSASPNRDSTPGPHAPPIAGTGAWYRAGWNGLDGRVDGPETAYRS
jgi:hypothetical protein